MMKRNFVLLVSICLLGACTGNDELRDYVAQVKNRPPVPIEPLPKLHKFEAMKFNPGTDRIPFADPQPELAQPAQEAKKNCIQPSVGRKKEPLEQYSLDNLKMRGTIGSGGQLWALIHSQDGEVYRVGPGQYMGLNYGQVTKVTRDSIELQEYVPDGRGCWLTRMTKLNLLVAK